MVSLCRDNFIIAVGGRRFAAPGSSSLSLTGTRRAVSAHPRDDPCRTVLVSRSVRHSMLRAMQNAYHTDETSLDAIENTIEILWLDEDVHVTFVGQHAEQRQFFKPRNGCANTRSYIACRNRVSAGQVLVDRRELCKRASRVLNSHSPMRL